MRATFTFEEPKHFTPSAMARMLIDLDGVFILRRVVQPEGLDGAQRRISTEL
jgi:hypothetical protein